MKNQIILFIIIFASLNTYSQRQDTELIPYKKGKFWGFMNQNKQIIIPTIYDSVSLFKHNIACFWKNDKIGVINKNGKVILAPIYDSFRFQSNNEICLSKKISLPPNENLINNNNYCCNNAAYFYFNINGRFIEWNVSIHNNWKTYPSDLTSEPAFVLEKFDDLSKNLLERKKICTAIIDTSGTIKLQNDFQYISKFNHGIAKYQKKDGKIGLIDSKGNTYIEGKYLYIQDYDKNGFAIVNNTELIDLKFNVIIPNKGGQFISYEKETDLYKVTNNSGVYIYNSNLKILNNEGFKRVWTQLNTPNIIKENKLIITVDKNNNEGLIDYNGNVILKNEFKSINVTSNKLISAKKGDKFAVFSYKGLQLSDYLYDYIFGFSTTDENYKLVGYKNYSFYRQNDKMGLIDSNLNVIIKAKYKDLSFLNRRNDSLLCFTNWDKVDKYNNAILLSTGIITTSGKIIFEKDEYFGVEILKNGYKINLKTSKKSFYLDEYGKIYFPLQYDDFYYLNNQTFIVKKNKKMGIYYEDKEIVSPIYDTIIQIHNNLFKVSNSNLYGIIDFNGNKIVPLKYNKDSITINALNLKEKKYLRIQINNKFGILDTNSNWLLPAKYENISRSDKTIFCDYSGDIDRNRIFITSNNKIAIFDENLNQLTDFILENIKINSHLDLIKATINDTSYVVNNNGDLILSEKFNEKLNRKANLFFDNYDRQIQDVKVSKEGLVTTKLINSGEIQFDINFTGLFSLSYYEYYGII